MKKIAIPLLAAVLCGCASKGPPMFDIQIESDPQGARIEVNNEYVGQTPTTYKIRGNEDRSFNGSWVQASNISFVATPPHDAPGLFRQEKHFSPSAFFKQGDHIPEKIFFDMHTQ